MKIYGLLPLLILFYSCSGINTVNSSGSMTVTKVGDFFLNDQVKVVDIKSSYNENASTISVKLQNLMWYEMELEVKMDFFDDEGIKLDNPWGWKPITLEEEQADWIKFIAPNNNAKDFKLYVQRAGN
jgi:uncharacterized protein YcfL